MEGQGSETFPDQVRAEIVQAAGRTIENGEATLREESPGGLGPVYYLIPSNPDAARLGVQPDTDQQITFLLGPDSIPYEVFRADQAELLAEVRRIVQTMIDGGYEEFVKNERRTNDRLKAVGKLHLGHEPVTVMYNVWWPRRLAHGWDHRKYQRY